MDELIENQVIKHATWLAKFLTIDFSIKIFGHEILAYQYPPNNENNDDENNE